MKTNKKVYAEIASDSESDERLRSLNSIATDELHDLGRTATSLLGSACILRQVERLGKKMLITSNSARLKDLAMDDFIKTNEICSEVIPKLDSNIVSDAAEFIRHALELYTYRETGDIQNVLNLGFLLQSWKYGPGASRGTRFTHFVDKIRIVKPTVTKAAYNYALLLRKMNPHLWAFDGLKDCEFEVVKGSSLSTVPKNETTERTIATEPLMNMALQLAAGQYIEGALRCVGLDITSQQEQNKHLAFIGSRNDSLCTIDLKNASDMISIALIKQLWPPEWYHLLSSIRSEECEIRGDWFHLHMVSTMGNGFTFPLMTLTLLALVYATSPCKRLYIDYETTAVFGDDIIVPKTQFEDVCETLQLAGLVVNHDKSYSYGPFRESCGGDYWSGFDITPFYPKSLTSEPDIYCVINQIIDWEYRTSFLLPKTKRYLLSLVKRVNFVPFWDDSSCGVHSIEVLPRYDRWVPDVKRVFLDSSDINSDLLFLMAINGYIRGSSGSRVYFIPRTKVVRYKLERARMPRGFRDGVCHDLHDLQQIKRVDFCSRLAAETIEPRA